MEDNRLFYDMSLESIPYYYNLHIQEMNYEFIESLYNKGLLELNESNIEYIHEAVADWYNKWRRATVTIIKSTIKQFSNYAMTVDMKYKPFLDENRDLFFKQTSYKNKSQISIKGKSYPELSAAIKRIGIPLTQSINGIDLNRVEVGNTDGGSKNMWLKRLLIPSYNGAGSFAKFAKDYFYGSDTKESLSGNRIQQVLPLAYNFCYNMNRTVRILKDEGNAIVSFIDKDPVTGERGYTTKSEVDLNKLQDKLPNMKASTNPYQNTPNLNKPTTEAVTSPNVPSASNSMNSPNVNSATYGGESTENMVQTLQTIQTGGTVFIVGLSVVALFMIANTIKITITARQTEISIMRMVGASNWYIRIPFMLEGMLIGLIGSIIPIIVLIYGYQTIYDYAGGALLSAMLALKEPMPFIRDFSLILAAIGAGVGLIGSFVSIRRFLKM